MTSRAVLALLDQAIANENEFVRSFHTLFGSDIFAHIDAPQPIVDEIRSLYEVLMSDSQRHEDILKEERVRIMSQSV